MVLDTSDHNKVREESQPLQKSTLVRVLRLLSLTLTQHKKLTFNSVFTGNSPYISIALMLTWDTCPHIPLVTKPPAMAELSMSFNWNMHFKCPVCDTKAVLKHECCNTESSYNYEDDYDDDYLLLVIAIIIIYFGQKHMLNTWAITINYIINKTSSLILFCLFSVSKSLSLRVCLCLSGWGWGAGQWWEQKREGEREHKPDGPVHLISTQPRAAANGDVVQHITTHYHCARAPCRQLRPPLCLSPARRVGKAPTLSTAAGWGETAVGCWGGGLAEVREASCQRLWLKSLWQELTLAPGPMVVPVDMQKDTHTLIHTLILLFIYYLNSVLPMFPSND